MAPLIHSKKPSAFSKNVRTEMHAGKPQKQALAIAYSVKNRAHKASGGMCECQGKGCAKCMDNYDSGGPVLGGAQTAQDSMRQAFHFKDGGKVDSEKYQKGVHKTVQSKGGVKFLGESEAGNHAVRASEQTTKENQEKYLEKAKEDHGYVLNQLKAMPDPKLKGLAHGGEVESEDNEVHEMVGPELMDAIHSKDHKKLMGCIEAMVLHHMNKKED